MLYLNIFCFSFIFINFIIGIYLYKKHYYLMRRSFVFYSITGMFALILYFQNKYEIKASEYKRTIARFNDNSIKSTNMSNSKLKKIAQNLKSKAEAKTLNSELQKQYQNKVKTLVNKLKDI